MIRRRLFKTNTQIYPLPNTMYITEWTIEYKE